MTTQHRLLKVKFDDKVGLREGFQLHARPAVFSKK